MRTVISAVLVVSVSLALCGPASAADPLFGHRENVNILNTYNPDLKITTQSGAVLGSSIARVDRTGELLGYYNASYRMFIDNYANDFNAGSGVFDSSFNGTLYMDFDFGEVQNVKTFCFEYTHSLMATGFNVYKVSKDSGGAVVGYELLDSSCVAYTNKTASVTLTLDAVGGVDTQYLRIVPAEFSTISGSDLVPNTDNRMILRGLSVLGAAGGSVLNEDKIDLISSTGLAGATAGNPVVQLRVGRANGLPNDINIADGVGGFGGSSGAALATGAAMFVDDANDPLRRMIMYSFNETGKWVEVTFTNGLVYEFTQFGIASGNMAAAAEFQLDVLVGVDPLTGEDIWETVFDRFFPFAYSANGSYTELPEGTVGTGIKLTLLNSGGGSNYISDLQLFGQVYVPPIPEPATMSLLALGGLALLRRRT